MAALSRRKLTPWMLGVGGVTFLARLLFGYDQGERDLYVGPPGPDALPG